MFLIGKGIPEHIRNLPQTFLSTPLGQMLKPQIENALRPVAQGTGTGPGGGPSISARAPPSTAPGPSNLKPTAPPKGTVRLVNNLNQLEAELASASNSCAVIFFTSATCPPCKIVYPTYDELAEEAGDGAVLIKCDVSVAYDVSMKYGVRATPTFMTFLKGQKLDEWSGANPGQLQGNVRLLLQMAHPPHPHQNLRLPTFQRTIPKYVTYKNLPPLDKLVAKLGQPHATDPRLTSIISFIKSRNSAAPADTPLPPNLDQFALFVQSTFQSLPADTHFALVDLVRALFLDPRVSGYFAESQQPSHETLMTLFSRSRSDDDLNACPYNLRIVMLHLACNLFTSPIYADQAASNPILRETCLHLLTSSLLDTDHANVRVVAASLAFNLAVHNHNTRFEGGGGGVDPLPEESQVDLTASLLEAISRESGSAETLHGLLFALGLLVYAAPMDGAVVDLCRAMGASEIVQEKGHVDAFKKEGLLGEVGRELLGRGL